MRQNLLKQIEGRATPFYCYDLARLGSVVRQAQNAASSRNFHLHYAVKANHDPKILRAIQREGLGADCVSGGEVKAALESGFPPHTIAFAGVGKADWEIELALEERLFSINVESIEELRVIAEIARDRGRKANIALRLNPGIDAKTHAYITTGLEENKFGIDPWQFGDAIELLRSSKELTFRGLHFHIGSQITSLEPFKNLCNRINSIQRDFAEQGLTPDHINAGGGLGIDYSNPDTSVNPDFEAYFGLFEKFLELRPSQELHFELGRALVATCGDLISRVLYVKSGRKTNFLILDAGMTELIRPALYQSYHFIENWSKAYDEPRQHYDVVGPVCESSDCFGKAVTLPPSSRGDIIAIRAAGAYGAAMASGYNLRTLQPSLYLD